MKSWCSFFNSFHIFSANIHSSYISTNETHFALPLSAFSWDLRPSSRKCRLGERGPELPLTILDSPWSEITQWGHLQAKTELHSLIGESHGSKPYVGKKSCLIPLLFKAGDLLAEGGEPLLLLLGELLCPIDLVLSLWALRDSRFEPLPCLDLVRLFSLQKKKINKKKLTLNIVDAQKKIIQGMQQLAGPLYNLFSQLKVNGNYK